MVSMSNLVLFLGTFAGYLILLAIIVVAATLGFCIGRYFGKKQEAKKEFQMENNEV